VAPADWERLRFPLRRATRRRHRCAKRKRRTRTSPSSNTQEFFSNCSAVGLTNRSPAASRWSVVALVAHVVWRTLNAAHDSAAAAGRPSRQRFFRIPRTTSGLEALPRSSIEAGGPFRCEPAGSWPRPYHHHSPHGSRKLVRVSAFVTASTQSLRIGASPEHLTRESDSAMSTLLDSHPSRARRCSRPARTPTVASPPVCGLRRDRVALEPQTSRSVGVCVSRFHQHDVGETPPP